MAGITARELRRLSPRPYRAMTNLGLTAVALAGEYDGEVERVLSHIAPVFWVEERLIDPLTVLLGAGPAIVAQLAMALIRAGVNIGIPWDLAREIVLSLMALELGVCPSCLSHAVGYSHKGPPGDISSRGSGGEGGGGGL